MHFSLTEQVALITGGNSGIGLCTAKRFLEAGAKVVVADLAPECKLEAQPNLLYRQCDVTQEDQVKAAMEAAARAFDLLTVVVNNAGTFSNYNAIQDKSADDFLKCHQVNLMGALHAMKHAANIMSSGGSIVNTASAAGLIGVVGLSDYVASKHALVG
ncbi:MAG: SDR family NAD(P)-dependent oxidoreductase, partial [Luminiphilus sp.]